MVNSTDSSSRTQIQFPAPTGSIPSSQFTTIHNSSSGDPIPSSGLHGHQAHIECTDIHAARTPIHIKELIFERCLVPLAIKVQIKTMRCNSHDNQNDNYSVLVKIIRNYKRSALMDYAIWQLLKTLSITIYHTNSTPRYMPKTSKTVCSHKTIN